MRFLITALTLAGAALALATEARADSRAVTTLGTGLPQPGASFEDVRGMTLADGQRLICDSDPDKPRLEQPKFMDPPSARGPVRIRRCAVFAPGEGERWRLGHIPSLAGPSRLWLVFVEQGIGGRFRLAQLSLWAKRESWDKVARSLGDSLGAGMATDRLLSWQDDQFETTMFMDEKYPDEFAVSVGDIRLRRLMRSPGTIQRTE
ncbi:hypothetical protein A6A04_01335 [Paramagnetospirillum marisnigri]|uniref:Uncharacterized protein n=1 Tax=Paramagnetospirillum marisnigri TaxID=1285242 RepID=A0A178MRY3_9PROT|nr:hypothetical protein [Paramagnetospirillum marisnigri]OAN52361.1 hypothetical protein A6A04_01335 [Paramagnetospirillum marisnigri]